MCTENSLRFDLMINRLTSATMVALFCFLLTLFASPFKSKARLEAENAALRHQLAVLRRKVRGRIQFTNGDRLFLASLCALILLCGGGRCRSPILVICENV